LQELSQLAISRRGPADRQAPVRKALLVAFKDYQIALRHINTILSSCDMAGLPWRQLALEAPRPPCPARSGHLLEPKFHPMNK
jgi:hypothetical protein